MYIHPDAVVNTFVDVKIPDASELMKRFGLKTPQGHPDRVSDDVYSTPSNLHDVDPSSKYLHEFGELVNSLASASSEDVSSEALKSEEQQIASYEKTTESE